MVRGEREVREEKEEGEGDSNEGRKESKRGGQV